MNVNRISTLYAPLESGPIPREATVSSSIYTEDLPAGNPSSLSDASGLESPPISVITETVPPPYSAATDGPEIIEARSMTSAVLSVGNTSWMVPVTVDDGADFSLMGFNHLENFKDLAVPQSPIQFRVANDNLATCSNYLLCDITLHTEAGNITVRRHRIYIADISISEVLLGRPFLHRLGIDVESQIRLIACKDSEPTPPSDVLHDHILDNAPSLESNDLDDIRSFLEARVQDCISNNAPSGFVNSLRALLLDFIDIFRISLCSDPPVKVTPLILKQSSSSVPVLANCRVMPAVAREYMRRWSLNSNNVDLFTSIVIPRGLSLHLWSTRSRNLAW